jgi:hypothetical protein
MLPLLALVLIAVLHWPQFLSLFGFGPGVCTATAGPPAQPALSRPIPGIRRPPFRFA